MRKRGKEETKFETAALLWGREVTLYDCRMYVLTHFLFKRMIFDAGEGEILLPQKMATVQKSSRELRVYAQQ